MLYTLFSFFQTAHAAILTSVPFQNIILNAKETLIANYNFKQPLGDFSVLFCYSNDMQNIDTINWPLNGIRFENFMPITLITNGLFEGQFADKIGTIRITNTLTIPSIVNCVFAF